MPITFVLGIVIIKSVFVLGIVIVKSVFVVGIVIIKSICNIFWFAIFGSVYFSYFNFFSFIKGVRFLDLEGGIGFLGPIKGLGEDDTKNVF